MGERKRSKAPVAGAPPAAGRRKARPRRRVGGVVAVTGIHGALASRLVRRLEEDDRYGRLVLLDVRAPSRPVRRSVFHQVDLTEPLCDAALAHVLRIEEVETIVHLALRECPRPHAEGGHELETVGTMYLLNAAVDCLARGTGLRALVAVTSAMVYGASARNPAYLTEDQPLHGASFPGFVADKVQVEHQLEEFRREQGLPVCVLRPCWTLGDGGSIAERLLGQSLAFSVLGFDPLMQLLHAEDLLDVVKRAVDAPRDGAFNVAGRGVLPLSALFRLAGRLPIALPAAVAYPAAELLWRSYGVGTGVSLDFLRYVWAVDGDATAAAFDAVPRWSTREVAESRTRTS